MDTPVLDAALSAMPVYRVGIRFDGVPVLSHDDTTPAADTEVWFADGWGCPKQNECGPECPKRTMCGKRVSAFDAEDMTDVSWFAAPEEYMAPKVAAAGSEDETYPMAAGMDSEGDSEGENREGPSEGDLDEMGRAVAAAEERVGQLEGLVASVILSGLTDNIFVDEPKQAAAINIAVTSNEVLRAGFDEMAQRMAVVAALDPNDLPPDLADRIDKVVERLDALEESVAELMLDEVDDEELLTREDSSTFVDETLPDDDGDENEDDPPEDPDGEEDDESSYPKKKAKRKGARAAATGLPLTVEAREKAADKGQALPDGKLPIRTLVELRSAIKLRGKVEGHSEEAIKAHIVKRARALGATDELPEEWR